MARFEQRRNATVAERAKDLGVKGINPNNKVTFIENRGNPGDLSSQVNNYYRVGYDKVQETPEGVFMQCPVADVEAYERHQAQESTDMLQHPMAAGLGPEHRERNSAERLPDVGGGEFLDN